MKREPELEKIIEAAFDAGKDHASIHGDSQLGQFARIARALRTIQVQAPPEVVTLAHSLMPEGVRRTLWAKLKAGSLVPAGARSGAATSFQLSFEADETEVRLMYARVPTGWEVTGRASQGLTPTRKRKQVRADEMGRFTFTAKNLEDTGLSLSNDQVEVVIPPATEADGSRGTS